MDSLLIGGRCERHLSPKPCAKCLAEYRAETRDLDLKGVLRLLHLFIGDGTQKAAAERMGVSQQYLPCIVLDKPK